MFPIRRTLLLFSINVIVFGCERQTLRESDDFALEAGDLLFQDSDCGPLCDAIEQVTTGCQGARFSHIGIVTKDDTGTLAVIEAVSSGVEITPLQAFLGRSFDGQHRPKVVVGRLKEPYRRLIPSALEEALALKGKPYDKVFAIGNESYYCSELIYEIFLRANNNDPVFELQPMTFKSPGTGSTFPEWQEYFSGLGVPVPEGQPGINPGGISRSRAVAIIHEYGTPDRSRTNLN
ncbi:MAG: YiiX/YebB-like N1pC/P60 family cysteine hydrolase [Planctomycetota bacterium]